MTFIDVLLLSLLAGGATGIGGLIVLFKKPGKNLIGLLMGFSGGVMLALSIFELIPESIKEGGVEFSIMAFLAGAVFIFIVDMLLPHIRFGIEEKGVSWRIFKVGLLVAIGIAIHNIPEGFVVGAGYQYAPQFGLLIAMAIAMHNIPEGIATALPLRVGGASKTKAFSIALLSGLVEPIGAILAFAFLSGFPYLIPASLAFAAGVMIFITIDELIPVACEYGKKQHVVALGIFLGIVMVLLSLYIHTAQ
ncbi:MAG: ZIP family metal transporter [Candidatus Micrarchaeia archaeon]